MAVNPNEDTEFNDILRKHGVLPPRPPTPPSPSPPPSPTLSSRLQDLTPSELLELMDEAKDDTEARLIHQIRQSKLRDLQRDVKRARFGRVYPIGREDYKREVTEASEVDEVGEREGLGTGVVCFLYKDGIPRSDRTSSHLQTLASKHPRTKFVSIVGDKCIPNLPDTRIPMLIVYRKGEIKNQIIAWGADRERRIEELEAVLILCGAIIPPDSLPRRKDDDSDQDEDEEDGDRSSRMQSSSTMTNSRNTRNISNSRAKEEDSDSDFDL